MTLQYNPGTYHSVHGDLIFTLADPKTADPVTYPDYKFICDIYISGVQVARLKSVPRPDNKIGIFNIGNIVRNYVAASFNPNNTLNAQTSGAGVFYIEVTCKFGEDYNFTTYTNILVDSARIFFNHYNGRLVGTLTNLAAYAGKPITVRPSATPVYSDSLHCYVPYFNSGSGDIVITATSKTSGGTTIATYTLTIASDTLDNTSYLFDVSPAILNAAQPGFTTGASYYIVDFNGTQYRFNLVCETMYEVFTLHFLNRFGDFESRNFTKVSRKVLEIEKKDFSKLGYDMDPSGQVSYKNTNGVYHETRSIYSSQYKEKITLNTDLLTDAEYQWMADLILSPMVYVEQAGYFIPVVITQNNYEFKKVINDELTNLTLTIEFGDQLNAQYR